MLRQHVVARRVEDRCRSRMLGQSVADELRGAAAMPANTAPTASTISGTSHHQRAFVHMLHRVMVGARLAVEGHEQQPPGVERGQERGEQRRRRSRTCRCRCRPRRPPPGSRPSSSSRRTAEDAGQRQAADPHHHIGDRDHACQMPPILRMSCSPRHRVDHRAGAQEQQRLEEGVGDQVEDRRLIRADAGGDEHVAELRAGRIGDDPLDVVLHAADRRGEQRGRARR